MNFPEILGLVPGILQFVVAGYAFQLNRLYGSARVGWSLFWAFLLLALLHLIQSIASLHSEKQLSLETSMMYTLISLLLLTGMVHLKTVLQERIRVEREEQRMRGDLEAEVKKKTAYLTRALEGLQAEIDERKRMEGEMESVYRELYIDPETADLSQDLKREASERKRLEAALAETENLFHTLLDHLPDAVYCKDVQGRFLCNSRTHLRRLGLPDQQAATGKMDVDFLTEACARQALADEQRVMTTGQPITVEEKETWLDGHTTWSLNTKLPWRDASGSIIGTLGISQDITGRQQPQAQSHAQAAV